MQDSNSIQSLLGHDLSAVNPWEHDDPLVTSLRNCLIQAQQMGHNTLEEDNQCGQELSTLPSMRLIQLQKDRSSRNRALQKVERRIANSKLEKEQAAFTHLQVIESQINTVKELCTDFDSIIKKSNILRNRLQKPFVGQHIKMDAVYHSFAKEVFSSLVPSLNDVSIHLDNIIWISHTDLSASQLDDLLKDMESLIASVSTSLFSISQYRNIVDKLCMARIQDKSPGRS